MDRCHGRGSGLRLLPAARMTIWALTLPQVAATLAATLVAHHTVNANGQRMLDERMLNAVLVLMVATSVLGPVLTERFAPRMLEARKNTPGEGTQPRLMRRRPVEQRKILRELRPREISTDSRHSSSPWPIVLSDR